MKNGSIEFVAVIAEKFRVYIEPFAYYEFSKDYEDLGFGSGLSSSRNGKEDYWVGKAKG